MKVMTQAEFNEIMDSEPVFLIGAGASAPLLPTAAQLKVEIVEFLLTHGTVKGNCAPPLDARENCIRTALITQLSQPHITLEVLCSLLAYRAGVVSGKRRFNIAHLWNELCRAPGYTVTADILARIAAKGQLGPILTSNFDHMLMDAAAVHGTDFRMVTEKSCAAGTVYSDAQLLVAFHGTTHGLDANDLGLSAHSPPTSALARGLATPFSRPMAECLKKCLTEKERPIICVGYSGGDHYDMNPLLNSLSDDVKSRFYWLCYSGSDRSVSTFVRTNFPDRLFAGKADLLLTQYWESKWPVRDGKKSGASATAASVTWRNTLQEALGSFEIAPERCDILISDILRNLPGTFAVLEHYYLYSLAYLETDTLVFAGVEQKDGDFSAEHLSFFGVPFQELLLGQYMYRHEDRVWRRLSDRREQSLFTYPESTHRFSTVLGAIRAKIRGVSASESLPANVLPEYRAILFVGLAIAYDYLGLVANKRLQALEAWSDHEDADDVEDDIIERRIIDSEITSARSEALAYFTACEKYASTAQKLIENDRDPLDQWLLEQVVQARTWVMIGKDNRARAASRKSSYDLFKSAIKYREQEVARSDDPEYQAAHDSQMWLRASELVKRILDIRSGRDPIRADLSLTDDEEQLLVYAMDILRKAHDRYYSKVGEVYSRLPAVFDAQLLYVAWTMKGEASSARDAALTNVIVEMDQRLLGAPPQVKSEFASFVNDIHARYERLRRTT